MNRLTNDQGFARNVEAREEMYDKLFELENIEEELGIDLITLFKALKNGFYFKYKDKTLSSNDYFFQISVTSKGNFIFDIVVHNLSFLLIKFKDYGKTWVLTREEVLENDR